MRGTLMMSLGTWWLRSQTDPRWNTSGRREVGMFMGTCPEAEQWIVAKQTELGERPPADLQFGYMKD